MIIGIDFDGTCVAHDFPRVGKDIGSVPILKKLIRNGHQLILWTMRSDMKDPKRNTPDGNLDVDDFLTHAVAWFKEHNIPLYGIQTNPGQKYWTDSPKAHCNLYIDDLALGVPLIFDINLSKHPFVDWVKVEEQLISKGLI